MFFYQSQHKRKEFSKLFVALYPKVKGFAESILKSEEEAKDVAQEVFLKLWDKPDIWIDKTNSCSSYVYTITKNYIFDLLKHKKVERAYQEDLSIHLLTELNISNPYSEIYTKDLSLLIRLTLNQMPEKRRLVFELSRFDGKSNNEIALQLELSVRTVERHIYLALSELKSILKNIDNER